MASDAAADPRPPAAASSELPPDLRPVAMRAAARLRPGWRRRGLHRRPRAGRVARRRVAHRVRGGRRVLITGAAGWPPPGSAAARRPREPGGRWRHGSAHAAAARAGRRPPPTRRAPSRTHSNIAAPAFGRGAASASRSHHPRWAHEVRRPGTPEPLRLEVSTRLAHHTSTACRSSSDRLDRGPHRHLGLSRATPGRRLVTGARVIWGVSAQHARELGGGPVVAWEPGRRRGCRTSERQPGIA